MSTPANITIIGQKPVAWSGKTTNITLLGVPQGANLSWSMDGSQIPSESAVTSSRNGSTTVTIPVGDVSSTTIKVLSGTSGSNTFNVNVTVLPDSSSLTFAEDPLWTEMFENPSGWTATGWIFETIQSLVGAHGTAGKQWFTRASGSVAAALGPGQHSLRSPSIALDGKGAELRFASHYNATGASGQIGTVSASYDGASPTQVFTCNSTTFSTLERIPLSDNATSVVLEWTLSNGSDASFWLIDDAEIVHALAPTNSTPLEVIDIISDIQGIEQNAWMRDSVLPGLRKLANSSTLVINGDLVNYDNPDNWFNFTSALNASGAHEYYKGGVISIAGNHEMFLNSPSSEEHIANFLNHTGMASVGDQGGLWGEQVTDAGTPIIWLASERYDFTPHGGFPPYVELSDRQFLYLAKRLEYWREQRRQVLLFSHHPLPYSVSGTYASFEATTFGSDESRVRYLLAANPHALLVTSHTHFDLEYNGEGLKTASDLRSKRSPPACRRSCRARSYLQYWRHPERVRNGDGRLRRSHHRVGISQWCPRRDLRGPHPHQRLSIR